MSKFVAAMLIVVGIIHLLPLSGVVGDARLEALYGLSLGEPNLQILMRHRAVLFGMLGALLIAAAFLPSLRVTALIAGAISVASFLWLAWSTGGYNDQIRRVVIADIIAAACLLAAIIVYWLQKRASRSGLS